MSRGPKIAVLDYGMGNLRSVEKALEKVGARASITSAEAEIAAADGIILPGVGAFPAAMRRIRQAGLDQMIGAAAAAGRPVLGICLGMQLLLDSSTEHEGAEGLGLIPGVVAPLTSEGLKVPHIGWSPVAWSRESALTAGLREGEPFYFVHSYVARPSQPADLLGSAVYGETFACALERDNVYAAQFHPEKSSAAGLRMLANFSAIAARKGGEA